MFYLNSRKEKLQERVDEWMSSMVWKMKEEDDAKAGTVKKKKKSATKNG